MYVNIHDAKNDLSKYLEQVNCTHEPIIICKSGVPVAQLTEYKKPIKARKFGALRGKIEISPDFDAMPIELKEYFE